MEKVKVQAAMAEIESNLQKEYFVKGKKIKHVTTELPHALLKKLARAKVNKDESYQFGKLGVSPVASKLSRKIRRQQENFTPLYNGNRYQLIRKEEFDEKKKKNVVTETYELIEG